MVVWLGASDSIELRHDRAHKHLKGGINWALGPSTAVRSRDWGPGHSNGSDLQVAIHSY